MKPCLLFILFVFIITGCRKEPKPEDGFTETYYLKFNFFGEEYKYEEDNKTADYSNIPGSFSLFNNIFNGDGHTSSIRIWLESEPLKADAILDLEGKNLAYGGNMMPYVRFIVDKDSANSSLVFTSDDVDPGGGNASSSFIVNEVIKGPRRTLPGLDGKTRTFILRGNFNCKVRKFNRIENVTNGIFSLPLHCLE